MVLLPILWGWKAVRAVDLFLDREGPPVGTGRGDRDGDGPSSVGRTFGPPSGPPVWRPISPGKPRPACRWRTARSIIRRWCCGGTSCGSWIARSGSSTRYANCWGPRVRSRAALGVVVCWDYGIDTADTTWGSWKSPSSPHLRHAGSRSLSLPRQGGNAHRQDGVGSVWRDRLGNWRVLCRVSGGYHWVHLQRSPILPSCLPKPPCP